MATTAFMTQYRNQTIDGFERRQSILRATTMTEAVIKGRDAIFLTADSNNAAAVTRGVNGLIPARQNNYTQNTCTLVELHDLVTMTDFNEFASQGNHADIMQTNSMGVINREIDDQIITALATGTNDVSTAAVTASLSIVAHARTILSVNNVPMDNPNDLFALVTPAFMGYLLQIPEFSSADYVDVKPLTGPARKMLRWAGFNWLEHSGLPGIGTASETCFFYHRHSIGHAADKRGMDVEIDKNKEQKYEFCRTSIYCGAKLLQNSGVVLVPHDGSGFAAV